MGILNKLLKKQTTMQAVAEAARDSSSSYTATISIINGILGLADSKSFSNKSKQLEKAFEEADDDEDIDIDIDLDKDRLIFEILSPEEISKKREFWEAYLSLLQACFSSAQLLCTVSENKSKAMSYALYEALKISFEPLIQEATGTKISKELKKFEASPTIPILSESGANYRLISFIEFFHKTGYSEEHLRYVVTLDDCIELMTKLYLKLESDYLELLNQLIITDWEKYVEGKYFPE